MRTILMWVLGKGGDQLVLLCLRMVLKRLLAIKGQVMYGRLANILPLLLGLLFLISSNGITAATTCTSEFPATEKLKEWSILNLFPSQTPQAAALAILTQSSTHRPVTVTACKPINIDSLGNPRDAICDIIIGQPAGNDLYSNIRVNAFYTQFCPNGYTVKHTGVTDTCVPSNSAACPTTSPPNPPKNQGSPQCGLGNPINPGTGDKYQAETDYQDTGKLRFTRYYHSSYNAATSSSVGSQWQHNYDSRIYSDGNTVARVIRANGKQVVYTLTNGVWVADADINDKLAQLSGGGWQLTTDDDEMETYDINGKLIKIQERSGYSQILSYPQVADMNGNMITKSLQDVTDTYGRKLSFTYDIQGRIATLIDPEGGKYNYTYDTNNNLVSVIYPDNKGRIYLYNEQTYTGNANLPNALTGIIDENNVTVDTNGVPTAISNAVRYATFTYDSVSINVYDTSSSTAGVQSTARAISTEHVGGVEKYQINYGVDINGNPTNVNTITDPLNSTYNRNFSVVQGMVKNSGQNQPAVASTNCPAAANAISYDTNGNVTRRTDFNGNTTCYAYDTSPNTIGKGRNLETVRIEGMAAGTTCPANLTTYTPAANERKITTEWHNRWRVPIAKAEPLRLTTWAWADSTDSNAPVCGADGVPCGKNVFTTTDANGGQGTSAALGTERTWQYTYNSDGNPLTVDGPRTDASDVTTYTYYPATVDSNTPANAVKRLHTATNAQGHTTTYSNYDGHGHALTIVDAKGQETDLTYDLRGRLLSSTTAGRTTQFAYYPTGLLNTVTTPANGTITYGYDPAHRLTSITNAAGEKITYTLDNIGNRTNETVTYANGSTATAVNRTFDNLSHLWQTLNAANLPVHTYNYDAQGNVTWDRVRPGDGTNQATQYTYDTLNRLLTMVDAANGNVGYQYDQLSHLSQVTDPKSNPSTYITDGLDNLTDERNPDRGPITNSVYDAAGNLLTSQDARGNTATYSYDSLNRLLSVAYVSAGNAAASNMDTNPNVTLNYRYDGNPNPVNNAKGKLSHIDDPTGATDWVYDSEGRVQSKTQTQGSVVKTLSYGYDSTTGRLLTITYPSGMVVQYSYDSTGRPSNLAVKKPTGANFNTLIGNISYRPLGPISSYQLTGVTGTPTISRSYDSDGRMTAYSLINATKQLGYDRLGNVKTWGNGDANDQTYTYDLLNRLTDTIIPGISKVHYDYDTNGNRTHAYTYIPPTNTTATSSTTYNIGSTSNLVTNNSYKYDLSGNLISSNAASPTAVNTYGYDSRNRFVALSVVNPSTQPKTQTFTYRYGINALGQRVSKTNIVAATGNIYLYDEAGHLVGEYDQTGALQQEHIWLGDQPVAVANSAQALFHVLSDHLNTPRQIVNTSGVVRWQWDSTDPFGNNAPNPNPTGTAANFTYNLRFPGQYYDGETGLFYNYYRTYDPKTGRYTQSDPIGLGGGLNTFGYVGGNPVNAIDPDGRFAFLAALAFGGSGSSISLGGLGSFALIGTAIGSLPWIADQLTEPTTDIEKTANDACPCPPCSPPVGTIQYRIDMVPPSKPHYPHTGSHVHLYEMHQSPSPKCKCFWHPIGTTELPPPPNTSPM